MKNILLTALLALSSITTALAEKSNPIMDANFCTTYFKQELTCKFKDYYNEVVSKYDPSWEDVAPLVLGKSVMPQGKVTWKRVLQGEKATFAMTILYMPQINTVVISDITVNGTSLPEKQRDELIKNKLLKIMKTK